MSSLHDFSTAIGWLYFLCWTISFYPQFWVNYKRKSISGLTLDYFALNVTGYLAYSTYTLVKYRSEGSPHTVEPNDIAFAFHGVVVTLAQIVQWIKYRTDRDKGVHTVNLIIIAVLWILALYTLAICLGGYLPYYSDSDYSLIEYLGYAKIVITVSKYVPQAYANYRRKSTVAWSIGGVLLDFSGGALSILQQFLDSIDSQDWSSFDNIPKFLLALVSIVFDVIFMIQHYWLYRHARAPDSSEVFAGAALSEQEYGVNGDSASAGQNQKSITIQDYRLLIQ